MGALRESLDVGPVSECVVGPAGEFTWLRDCRPHDSHLEAEGSDLIEISEPLLPAAGDVLDAPGHAAGRQVLGPQPQHERGEHARTVGVRRGTAVAPPCQANPVKSDVSPCIECAPSLRPLQAVLELPDGVADGDPERGRGGLGSL